MAAVGAALKLVLDLAPGGLDLLLLGDEAVVPTRSATGERQDENRGVLPHPH